LLAAFSLEGLLQDEEVEIEVILQGMRDPRLTPGVVAFRLAELECRDSCDDQVAEEIVNKDNLIVIIKVGRLDKMIVLTRIASHLRNINQSPKSRRK
jgi:hypothetical protein